MSIKRQTVWGMLPLLVLSVVNIFSMPLFLRWLGTDMYALWFYVITFSGTPTRTASALNSTWGWRWPWVVTSAWR